MRYPAIVGAIALTALLGSYFVADARDAVPGFVTDEPGPDRYRFAQPAVPAAQQPSLHDPTALTQLSASEQSALDTVARSALADPALGPNSSFLLYDIATGDTLVSVDPAVPRQPASTSKILTCVAALAQLGPQWRAQTQTRLVGKDTVVLTAGGDVLMGIDTGTEGKVNGHASLTDLARRTADSLKHSGVSSVRVVLDDSATGPPQLGPKWHQADIDNGYVSAMTWIAVDAGRLRPGRTVPRHADPALAASEQFSRALGTFGVSVTGPVSRYTEKTPTTEPIATVDSAPLSKIVGYVLSTSENNAAQALAFHVAIARGLSPTFAHGAKAVADTLAERDPLIAAAWTGSTLLDGAGLSDDQSVSAEAIGRALLVAARDAESAGSDDQGDARDVSAVVDGLAAAAVNGTMTTRFRTDESEGGAGVVRAKSGSLRGVRALAGTAVTQSGRSVVFVVLSDKVTNELEATKAIDKLVATIVNSA